MRVACRRRLGLRPRGLSIPVCALTLLAGCNAILGVDQDYTVGELGGGTPTATVTGTGGTNSGTGGSGGTSTGTGSGGTGTGGGDAGAPTTLTDRGLVARYYIDEAASGSDVATHLIDAAPNPLNLPLTWTAEMTYTETGGNRGLSWSVAENDGRAETALNGSKVDTALSGSGATTLEAVADVQSIATWSARCFDLGLIGDNEELGLRFTDTGEIRLRWKNGGAGVWPRPAGRHVIQVVIDTSQAVSDDRARLYVDGSLQTPGGTPPGAGETLAFPSGSGFCVGNRCSGGRSYGGTLSYAAIYSEALTEAEVIGNAQILLDDDDTP